MLLKHMLMPFQCWTTMIMVVLKNQMEKIQYIAYLMKNAETLLTACDLNRMCLELREPGKLEGILAAVYQNVFGTEVYQSIEEKAANLLYFLIKDHPFADGCKRIGATIFLEFLNKNNHLIIDHRQIISNSALVAITLMIAESRPEEKETMVKLVMNFLKQTPYSQSRR